MLTVTTPALEGTRILKYHGLVSGEAILGANIFQDLFAGIRDVVGGRSVAYEQELRKSKEIALEEMRMSAAALGTAQLNMQVLVGGTLVMSAALMAAISSH